MTAAHVIAEDDLSTVRRAALNRRATERLARIDDIRAAVRLSRAGKTQREIARILHVTQPVVHRLLRAARLVGTEVTPEEVILRAFVDDAPREALVQRLIAFHYSFPEYAPYPHEGKTAGTWDQVGSALIAGFITEDEYLRVRKAVAPPLRNWSHGAEAVDDGTSLSPVQSHLSTGGE